MEDKEKCFATYEDKQKYGSELRLLMLSLLVRFNLPLHFFVLGTKAMMWLVHLLYLELGHGSMIHQISRGRAGWVRIFARLRERLSPKPMWKRRRFNTGASEIIGKSRNERRRPGGGVKTSWKVVNRSLWGTTLVLCENGYIGSRTWFGSDLQSWWHWGGACARCVGQRCLGAAWQHGSGIQIRREQLRRCTDTAATKSFRDGKCLTKLKLVNIQTQRAERRLNL